MARDANLRPLFRQNLQTVFWTSIETGSTGRGIPDSFGISQGVSCWVEMKWTEANAVDLKPEQVSWMHRFCREGGRGFIAVRQLCDAGPRRPARDVLFLFHGIHAPALKAGGIKAVKPLGFWEGGPARWEWKMISAFLFELRL